MTGNLPRAGLATGALCAGATGVTPLDRGKYESYLRVIVEARINQREVRHHKERQPIACAKHLRRLLPEAEVGDGALAAGRGIVDGSQEPWIPVELRHRDG